MPAFSFHQRFEQPVKDGSKRHTIRAKRKQRPRPGQTFHGYVSQRSRNCRKILEAPITRVEDVHIEVDVDGLRIWVEDIQLNATEREQLARADGFESAEAMHRFWRFYHGLGHFDGDLIHWDYERRVKNLPPRKPGPPHRKGVSAGQVRTAVSGMLGMDSDRVVVGGGRRAKR